MAMSEGAVAGAQAHVALACILTTTVDSKRNTQKLVGIWWMEAWARSATAVRPFTSQVAKPESAVMFTIGPSSGQKPRSSVIATVRESV